MQRCCPHLLLQIFMSRESFTVATEVINQPRGAYIKQDSSGRPVALAQRCSDWAGDFCASFGRCPPAKCITCKLDKGLKGISVAGMCPCSPPLPSRGTEGGSKFSCVFHVQASQADQAVLVADLGRRAAWLGLQIFIDTMIDKSAHSL